MFSSTTTELSINRESTKASPPSTMVLMVPPTPFNSRNAARQETGIEIRTEMVPRTEPRKTRIITAVRTRPMPPSRSTLATAIFTYCDWSKTTLATSEDGISSRCFTRSRTPSTIAIVLLLPPCFRMGRYTDFCPSTRTMLYWMAEESSACPMSPKRSTPLPMAFSGTSFICDMSGSWLLL